MNRQYRINLAYFILAVFAVLWLQSLWVQSQRVERLSYSEFQQQLKAGRVQEIIVYENRIEGAFNQPTPEGHTRFVTIRVDPELAKDLEGYNLKYGGALEVDVPVGAVGTFTVHLSAGSMDTYMNDPYGLPITPLDLIPVVIIVPCQTDEDCDDGEYCNGVETCSGGICYDGPGDPCPGPDGVHYQD